MIATANPVQVSSTPQPVATAHTIETLQKTVSASRLNCWLSCRLRWAFVYVYQIVKAPTPALHLGSVAHLILREYNMGRWRKQPFRMEHYRKLFEENWADQPVAIDWDGDEPAQKTSGWSVLEVYFSERRSEEMPQAVEVPMEADLSKHGLPTLIGVLDLVAGEVIIDYKTTSKTPSAEDAVQLSQIQLDCYSVLYRDAVGKLEVARELHHLVRTKQPKVVVTRLEPMKEKDQARLFRLIESYVDGVSRQDFVPSPGLQCSSCQYRNECRQWC